MARTPLQRRKRIKAEIRQQEKRSNRHKPRSRARVEAMAALKRLHDALDTVNGQIKDRVERAQNKSPINWNGCPPLGNKRLRKLARMVTEDPNCYVTATTNGVHTATSWHYLKRALDFGSNDPTNQAEAKLQERMARRWFDAFFLELFGPASWYIKNGLRFRGVFPGHSDHGHAAA